MEKSAKAVFRQQAFAAFCTAGAVAGSGLMPGIEIYCSNGAEFTFGLPSLLLFSGCLAGLAGLLLWSILILSRNWKHHDKLNALLLATGCAIWMQYTFYSRCMPDWSPFQPGFPLQLRLTMMVNAILLLIPYVLIFWKRKWCYVHHWRLALIIVAPQILPLSYQLATYSKPQYDFYEYNISEEKKFTFASEENIIFLVVDAMGEYIFRQVWQNYPELHRSLKDFTCFDRMTSPVPGTPYAVPAMLTGVNYKGNHLEDGERKHAEYLKQACWSENSLFLNFKKLGYHTDAYPFILQTISYSPDLLDNAVRRNEHDQSRQLFLDVLFFRMTPLFLKPVLTSSYLSLTDPFVTPLEANRMDTEGPHDSVFYQTLQAKARTGAFKKGLKYLHLQGAHAFIRTDENLEYTYNTDVVRQLRGSLKNLELLIIKLKELGLYEQAMIIVTGDHSERYTPETVTMIKRPGENHPQTLFNSLPCQLSDLAITVLSEKKLRPPELSLFSYAPVLSTGETRLSVLPSFLPVANWVKNPALQNPFIDNPSLSEMPFSIENRQICIPVNGNQALPDAVHFLAQELTSREMWETDPSHVEKNERPPNYYQLSLEGLPDGDYVLFQVEKQVTENHSLWEDTTREEQNEVFYLPHYLLLRNGVPSFSKRYPGLTPRSLQINEKVIFEGMKAYPQLLIPDESIRTRHGLRLSENSILGVFLAKAENPLSLQMDMKIFTPQPLTLELYHEKMLLHSQPVPVASSEYFPVEFFIPADLAAGRKLKLQFRFVRKFKNRERRMNYKIQLSSLQLNGSK